MRADLTAHDLPAARFHQERLQMRWLPRRAACCAHP